MNEHKYVTMKLYKNKYRIPSSRAQWWDYAANGWYFVTICTHNRECFFGKVVGGEMRLSGIGEIAQACWMDIPKHFPFVQLDAFVVMPNHVHGIVAIDKEDDVDMVKTQDLAYHQYRVPHTDNTASPQTPAAPDQATTGPADNGRASHDPMTIDQVPHNGVGRGPAAQDPASRDPKETQNFASLPMNTFGPQSKNLASIIRGFKIGVTKNGRLIDPSFAWQPRYHDHIIRDEKSYLNISEYIINNPAKWREDKWHRT